MPLLLCPNCNVSMQAVRRHDVEIDMCPQCRSVWMDRGELEKILEIERGNQGAAPAPQMREQIWPERRDRDDDDYRKRQDHRPGGDQRHGQHPGQRKRSIFDFFDD